MGTEWVNMSSNKQMEEKKVYTPPLNRTVLSSFSQRAVSEFTSDTGKNTHYDNTHTSSRFKSFKILFLVNRPAESNFKLLKSSSNSVVNPDKT